MKYFVFLLLSLLGTKVLAEDRFANVEISITPVTDSISMLQGAGGNIGVFHGADGMLMIDDQFRPLAGKIKQALKTIGPDAPTFLLNTHYHGDHTGGNPEFGDDSLIMAHHNVRVRLIDGDADYPKAGLPVVTYTQEAGIHFNGEDIRLLHTPHSHTDGDTMVHFEQSNVLHMGDNFFKDRFPYVDTGAGGSVSGLIKTINMTLSMINDQTKIIPGHGSLANRADLERYLGMINETNNTVKAWVDAGISLEKVIATGLDAKWEGWGAGFINEQAWLTTLYKSHQK